MTDTQILNSEEIEVVEATSRIPGYTPDELLLSVYGFDNLSQFIKPAQSRIVGNPKYPTHDTEAARLLAILLRGFPVTALNGWAVLDIFNLTTQVRRLRAMGWPIQTERTKNFNMVFKKSRVSTYLFPADVMSQVGEDDLRFVDFELSLFSERTAAWVSMLSN